VGSKGGVFFFFYARSVAVHDFSTRPKKIKIQKVVMETRARGQHTDQNKKKGIKAERKYMLALSHLEGK